MASKTKNYLQTQLFPDEDLKLPIHDEIMFWLDDNLNNIIEELMPKNLSYLIDDLDKKNFNEEISEAIDFFRMSKSKEAEKNILKLENLKIYDANFDRKLPITIKSKIWEFPINEVIKNYNYSNKKAIGFVDMMVSFDFPSYPILVGIDKKNVSYNWDYNKKYEYQLKDEIYVDFKKANEKLYFEVKTKIDSVGTLIRQINYYRNSVDDGKFVVVSEDDRFVDLLKEQNILFFKYDKRKFK
jgi:hypothetical protein